MEVIFIFNNLNNLNFQQNLSSKITQVEQELNEKRTSRERDNNFR
jgi:hypothetical protein